MESKEEKQKDKKLENYSREETKAWLKSMEHVYEPFFEPGDFQTDSRGRKRIIQEDGNWGPWIEEIKNSLNENITVPENNSEKTIENLELKFPDKIK